MHTHGPKRIYSPQSLEWWFERLSAEWEAYFPAAVLELGREVYRASEIREIELGASDAIIHRRVEKKEDYTVIEWAEERPSVRSSSTDETVAQAIAVAGLYEIEELLAEEIPALPAATPAPKPPTEKPSISSGMASAETIDTMSRTSDPITRACTTSRGAAAATSKDPRSSRSARRETTCR